MRSLYRNIGVLLLSVALVVPQAIMATPNQDENRQNDTRDRQNNGYSRNQQANGNKRVYDSAHRDYHNWDNNEDQAWRQYLSDHHKKYHDYSKATKSEQSVYWNERHQDSGHNRSESDYHQNDRERSDSSRDQNRRPDDNPR